MPPTLLHYADIETALDRPERVARLAGLVAALRDDRTVVVGTGDDTGPGALPLVTDGRAALDAVEALAPAAEVPGNHDFDAGLDAARHLMREAPMPFLAANLRDGDARAPPVEPWRVVTAGDERVGLVGVTHPETGSMNPEAAALRFDPVLPAAREAVAAVRDRADHVVVLAHLGTGTPDGPGGRDLARELDVDAVLDGHRHEAVTTVVDGTHYARPGQGAEWLVAVDLGSGTACRHPVDAGPEDARLADRLRERAREHGLTEVVATADHVPCDRPAVRAAGSTVGARVVDAYRRVGDADAAFVAPAAIRSGPALSGDVTAWELLRLVPFGDDLVTLAVDGSTLFDALGRVSGDGVEAFPDWYFGHVSGCRLRYDEAARELVEARVGGEAVDPTGRYRLATTEYYVRSDHIFPGLSAADVVERHGPQYEAVRDDVAATGLAVDSGVPPTDRVERVGFDGVPGR